MNVLHIIEDNKFLDIAKETFDIDGLNNFFIKSKDFTSDFVKDENINIIFFHYLTEEAVNIINNNTFQNVKLVWMFWGNDGLSLPNFNFLENLEKEQYSKYIYSKGLLSYFKYLFTKKYNKILNYREKNKSKLRAINKVDLIVPIVPGDYYLLKNEYNIIPKYAHFNYYINKTILKEGKGNNVLVGNSASFTNNHFTIFNKLRGCQNIKNNKIIFPLNYGNIDYKNYFKTYVSKADLDNVVLLEEFLSLEDYKKIIASCDIVIMNHARQQALGNIIMALYNRCTIYMNPKSTLYKFLIDKGFYILKVSDIEDELIKLSDDILDINYMLATRIFSKENQVKKIKKIIQELSL